MPPAVGPALLLAASALCLANVTAATPRDASPLRSLRTEEGNIDALISRIEQLQQQKRRQQQPPLPPVGRHPGVASVAPPHPPRRFAYYPSDPEYHSPRAPEVITPRAPKVTTPSASSSRSTQGRVSQNASRQEWEGPPTVTESPAAPAVTSGSDPTTPRDRGDPEEVSHAPARQKRPSDDTQVVQVQAESLLGAPNRDNLSDVYFIVTVAGVCAMTVGVTVAGGFCYHRMQKRSKAAGDAEYPAYGVTGPSRDLSPSGDRKLAQSAQMYHYQHQKQQMMAMEKTHNGRHGSASDVDSEEENEEGDYTVYECPGLAPTGEMEVKNPLFQDDQTPAPPAVAETNGK